jgi:hypothetical protein
MGNGQARAPSRKIEPRVQVPWPRMGLFGHDINEACET